jgi:hypothetical protein
MIGDQRGAIYLELLISYLPVLLFFFGVLQLADVAAAHLIVQRAAGAAARAAVVVIPDDEVFYTGTELSARELKRADIERAADMILRATHRLDEDSGNVELNRDMTIEHDRDRLRDPVTARVSAEYRCFARLFCGLDGTVTLHAEATLPYQGARYRYPSEG